MEKELKIVIVILRLKQNDSETESESEEEEYYIPSCPIHEAKMAELRADNVRMRAIIAQQEIEIEEMVRQTEEIRANIAALEARREELRIERERDLAELRELGMNFWDDADDLTELAKLGMNFWDDEDMEEEGNEASGEVSGIANDGAGSDKAEVKGIRFIAVNSDPHDGETSAPA